jgi:transglutaminase-like putative cysteine protease
MSGHRPRTLPGWILGLAILFWGWQAELLPLSCPLLVLALAPGRVRRRFEFSQVEFHRALDVCWVLLLGGLLLVYGREPLGGVLRSFSRWLPVVAFPAVMAQVWSARGWVPASALIPLPGWRRQVDPSTVFDVVPIYLAICLIAASVTGAGRPWFYPGVVLVGGAAFWSMRAPGLRPAVAAGALGLAAVGGWFAAGGIGGVQQWVEAKVLTMVGRWRSDEWSSRTSQTAIGRTGKVGGSSRIVMQVRTVGQGPSPRRLRVSVFTVWRGDGTWIAPRLEPEKVDSVGDEWRLDRRPGRDGSVLVEWDPERTTRLLPLPATVRSLSDFSASQVMRTGLGTVRADVKSGVVSYRADYGPDAEWEFPASEEDKRGFSEAELPGLRKFARELGLEGLAAGEVVQRIGDYFERHFRYTTDLVAPRTENIEAMTAVGRFLHGSRAGHCEYFATSATLLLRSLGIPARYVTGYVLAGGEGRPGDPIVVRERQAHAWVRVWIDGAWRDFDPTPSGALDAEPEPSGLLARLARGWSDFRFSVSRWWWLGEKRLLRQAYWLAIPLLAGLLWRLRRVRETGAETEESTGDLPEIDWPGRDSEWFRVEPALEREGWTRRSGESAREWSARLMDSGCPQGWVAKVAGAYGLHQRLRFDPRGLDYKERERLRSAATQVVQDGVPSAGDALSGVATRA